MSYSKTAGKKSAPHLPKVKDLFTPSGIINLARYVGFKQFSTYVTVFIIILMVGFNLTKWAFNSHEYRVFNEALTQSMEVMPETQDDRRRVLSAAALAAFEGMGADSVSVQYALLSIQTDEKITDEDFNQARMVILEIGKDSAYLSNVAGATKTLTTAMKIPAKLLPPGASSLPLYYIKSTRSSVVDSFADGAKKISFNAKANDISVALLD